ncbi:MAG: hypothetical protein AUI14_24950 [Actinobacteria bacterium 13_2_20CM_2_71_6]|nr:MAG: hypothetical protein AUI14_24950 [Actinobacteria bacterium 13_2_20CM_2_71_6]
MSFAFLPSYLVLWAVVLLQALIIVGLVRSLGEIREVAEMGRYPHRLPLGARAPRLRGTDLRTGAGVDSSDLAGQELVVLFLTSGCSYCRRLADSTRRLPAEPSQSRIAVCQATAEEAAAFVQALAPDIPVLVDPSAALHRSYGVRSAPVVFVVDAEGRVRGSGSARHAGELEGLINVARQSAVPQDDELATAGT